MLASCDFSLRTANQEKIAFYRRNLRALLAALGDTADPAITWNSPSGGFSPSSTCPSAPTRSCSRSPRGTTALWTPMSFFYLNGGGSQAIRLCSALTPGQVDEGVGRLAKLIADVRS